MKQSLRTLLLVTVLAAGCEKSSNVTAMQDETAALANQYRSRFEELTKRYQQIDKTKKGDLDGEVSVKNLWALTGTRLTELRTAAAQAQNSIAAAMKSPNPSNDLIRLQADLRERLQRGEIEVTANLHTIESWLSMRAYAPKVAAVDTGTAGANARGGEPDKADPSKEHETPKTDGHDHAHDHKADGVDVTPKTDAKADAKDAAKKDAAKTDVPKKDAPKTDVKKDAPKTDAPKQDPPKTDAPKKDPKTP